jgi:hypothetical protein
MNMNAFGMKISYINQKIVAWYDSFLSFSNFLSFLYHKIVNVGWLELWTYDHPLAIGERMERRGSHKDHCMKHSARQWPNGFC